MIEERADHRPCVAPDCGEPIQPEQLYVPGSDGPMHIVCARRVEEARRGRPIHKQPQKDPHAA